MHFDSSSRLAPSSRLSRWLLVSLLTSLTSLAAQAVTIAITPTKLTSTTAGTTYSLQMFASGGKAPYLWSSSAALPAGLALAPSTGFLTGEATTSGTYTVTLIATDANAATGTKAFSLVVAAAKKLATQYATVDSQIAGTAYSKLVTATGGYLPYTWSSKGVLPPGMTIAADGTFGGNATTTGEYKFSLVVTDSVGATASAAQDVWVSGTSTSTPVTPPPPPPPPTTPLATQYAELDSLTVGTAYSKTVTATGGTLPYTWSTTGTVPPGMSMAASGLFSGTPTTNGEYKFSVVVTDSLGATATLAEDLWVSGGTTSTGGTGGTTGGGTTTPPPPATYTATIVNGTGSGTFAVGATVTISANTPAAGVAFANWTGTTVANATAPNTSFVMPAANTTVTANFSAVVVTNPVTPGGPTNPILFVTQIPIGFDFSTITSTFGNQRPSTDSVGRGGDLYIRYADGTVKNLTAAAGYGVATGFQGAGAIAVRDPAVHWSGTKAIFSMVVGAPASAYGVDNSTWQLYEITNFGEGQTPVITQVSNQPAGFNNIAPTYGTNGRIIFTSDRPRTNQAQLYPQLDEYEMAATVSGLWSLDPNTGDLFNLNHTPSGAFNPFVDSFGRVIFTRWDHLQRDQEADIDLENVAANQPLTYGTFNYSDESAGAAILAGVRTEVFPESRITSGNVNGHVFNVFFPWMINEDGTQEETVNHIGGHEIGAFAARSFLDDTNLVDGFDFSARTNQTYLTTMLQIKEDPTTPGKYYGIDAPEFGTHASGLIVALSGPPTTNPDQMPLTYITYPSTRYDAPLPAPATVGKYREPLPLSNGTLVAVYENDSNDETQSGGVGSDYAFRLTQLQQSGQFYQPFQNLTSGIQKTVSYYANGAMVNYSGILWELNPVEVRARPIPASNTTPIPATEQAVFAEVGVSIPAFQAYLKANSLALIVSRNLTTRDHADHQQPYNLEVPGTTTKTVGAAGKVYDISSLQIFQGDQIRGLGVRDAGQTPVAGRRVLAQPLHDAASVAANIANPNGPVGSVAIGSDGSVAAFVPARRALTWQVSDPSGNPVVRERYWLTFQPGEVRSCTSCHGINEKDQAGNAAPVNEAEALRAVLIAWKAKNGG